MVNEEYANALRSGPLYSRVLPMHFAPCMWDAEASCKGAIPESHLKMPLLLSYDTSDPSSNCRKPVSQMIIVSVYLYLRH